MDVPTTSTVLFRPSVPHQPVAALFLVENSVAMSSIWHDLKDRYLEKLVDTVHYSNPSVPLAVSVLESYPYMDSGSNSSLPRQHSGQFKSLGDVRFSSTQDNRISAASISNAIDALVTGEFQGQCPALHLIIVAATTPSQEQDGQYFTANGYSPWSILAPKFARHKVHCHLALALSPHQDMSVLSQLFDEALRIQGDIETVAPFAADRSVFHFRFSSILPINGESGEPLFPPQQPIPQRRSSYPLDNFYQETFEQAPSPSSPPSDPEPTPTLVSQLQQFHGLTKKKVYGAKPARQPFFREERVREKYRAAPAPLTMSMPPPEKIPSPTAGGRVLSQARADRMNRLSQASPTDLYARRPFGRPCRASRLSTPEPEPVVAPPAASDISPGSPYISSDYSSPITPGTSVDEMYAGHVVQSSAIHTAPVSSYQAGGVPDVTWSAHPYPGSYSAQSQSYFPPTPSAHYSTDPRQQASDAQKSYSYSPTQPSSWQVSSATPSGPVSSGRTSTDPSTSSANIPRAAKKTLAQEEEDEHFAFSDEYVAATAILFESEVLPSYPDFPGSSSGLVSNIPPSTLPHVPSSQAGGLYASRPRHRSSVPTFNSNGMAQGYAAQHHQSASIPRPSVSSHAQYYDQSMGRSGHRYAPTYLPGGSSLTGWAG